LSRVAHSGGLAVPLCCKSRRINLMAAINRAGSFAIALIGIMPCSLGLMPDGLCLRSDQNSGGCIESVSNEFLSRQA